MKKIIIISIICLLLMMGIFGYIVYSNNKMPSVILDINPIIELKLKDNYVVNKMIALDDDAKKIVDNSLKNKKFEEVIDFVSDRLVEENYIPYDDDLEILICSTGDVDLHEIATIIHNVFDKKEIHKFITSAERVSSKDIKLAKEKNISVCKAAYINSIIEDNSDISMDYLLDSSIQRLRDAKERGLYCDKGYYLEYDSCVREIGRVEAKPAKVCPEGYGGYNGKCYKDGHFTETEKETCYGDFVLKDGKCFKSESYGAEGICEEGNYDFTDDKCHVRTYTGDATEYCMDPGRTKYEHKCLATKPTLNGRCLGSDVLYSGKCVNMKNDFVGTDWKCAKGSIFDSMDNIPEGGYKCYLETKVNPESYTCNNDRYTLVGKKCTLVEEHKVEKVRVCEEGYTLNKDGRCLNYKDTTEMIDGYMCDNPGSRVIDNICVIYEKIEANIKK